MIKFKKWIITCIEKLCGRSSLPLVFRGIILPESNECVHISDGLVYAITAYNEENRQYITFKCKLCGKFYS